MSRYRVYVTPSALGEIKALPAYVRQRVKRAIDDLENDPHPPGSRSLDLSGTELPAGIQCEVWRLRMDKWRVLYAITDVEEAIDVLAVRQRPPYDYGDLEALVGGAE